MSNNRQLTTDELRRLLESSDYEISESSSNSDSDEDLFADDDSVTDPNYVPSRDLQLSDAVSSDVSMLLLHTHEDPRSSNYSPILSEHSIDDERIVNNAPVTSVSLARVGRALTLDNMKECDERDGWNYKIQTIQHQEFSTDKLVHLQHIPENASIFTIYRLLVDDEALELMVQQTNLYAEQTKVTHGGRMA
ncbi:hypothetical protein EVAR_94225_1 [Eumeta japonica]|uniref:PiggyBac transposable element-derived protein domain-containing protein n=1 Tax=Eumeta variegata TaxID=151549 RepID=A0A4C1UN07_EUMVA|nr:hypothetical protein EVAR_94225_1 [Eumeta japonica]